MGVILTTYVRPGMILHVYAHASYRFKLTLPLEGSEVLKVDRKSSGSLPQLGGDFSTGSVPPKMLQKNLEMG